MANLPHDIILTAYKSRYSKSPRATINFLLNRYSIGTSPELRATLIRELLDLLEKKQYITWGISRRLKDSNDFAYDESFKYDFADKKRTFYFYDLQNSKFFVSLNPDGIDYAIDIDRKRVQHLNNILAIIFAGLTVLLTFISLLKTIISQRELDNQQQQIKLQVQSLDSITKVQKSQIDYLYQDVKNNSLAKTKQKDSGILNHSLNK